MSAPTVGGSPDSKMPTPQEGTAAKQRTRQSPDTDVRNNEALTVFLDAVFGGGQGILHTAILTNQRISDTGKYEGKWTEATAVWPEDRNKIAQGFVALTSEGADVYLSPYLSNNRERNKGSGIRRHGHADCDGTDVDLDEVKRFGGFAVASGTEGHAHLHFPLAYPLAPAQHEKLQHALVKRFKADPAKISDNDMLRVPGTLNHKPRVFRGEEPAPVRFLIEPSGERIDPFTLAAHLGVDLSHTADDGEIAAQEAPQRADSEPEEFDLDSLPAVVKKAVAFVSGDRSVDMYRIVAACKDAFMTLSQTRYVINSRPDLVGKLAENQDRDDVLECWNKIADLRDWSVTSNERDSASAAPPPGQPNGYNDTHFWQARHSLTQIWDYSMACMLSPWGVLGTTLVYALDLANTSQTLPGIADDDSPGSLNLFVALVAPSGGNKGRTETAARKYAGSHTTSVPAGSGEGLVKAFARRATHKEITAYRNPQDSETSPADAYEINGELFIRKTGNAIISVPEIDTLLALGDRNGSTLNSTLRQAFSGETLGFSYSDDAKRIIIPAQTYRLGLIVGVQPERSAALLNDAGGGTPQRFLWMPVADRRVSRDNRPNKPPPLTPSNRGWPGRIPVCQQARNDIEIAAELRGQGLGDPLDGHLLFVRLKVAFGLALIDGRKEVRDDDWELAATVIDVSNATRQMCLDALAREAAKVNRQRAINRGEFEDIAAAKAAEKAQDRVAANLVRKINEKGPMKRKALKGTVAGRDKGLFAAALNQCLERGELTLTVDQTVTIP